MPDLPVRWVQCLRYCNHCRSHGPFRYKGEEALRELLDSRRNPASDYDCLVAISGGRDSTYTLLKLARDLERRVLAVNYRNPFTHPQAERNIKSALEKLGVDLVSFRLRRRVHQRTARRNLIAWLNKPAAPMVGSQPGQVRRKKREAVRNNES